LDDPSKLVRLYALVGKLRLFASANVVSQAEEVMQRIVETYNLPNRDFHKPEDRRRQDADLLHAVKTCAFRIFPTKVAAPLHWGRTAGWEWGIRDKGDRQ
jgi:uncharacterized protein YqiB (DUF1249 family)